MKELKDLPAEANGGDSRPEGIVGEGITGGDESVEGRGSGAIGVTRNSLGGEDGERNEKVNRRGVLVCSSVVAVRCPNAPACL